MSNVFYTQQRDYMMCLSKYYTKILVNSSLFHISFTFDIGYPLFRNKWLEIKYGVV